MKDKRATPPGTRWAMLAIFLVYSSSSLSHEDSIGVVEGEKRRFEVRDSIEMSYFGTIAESHPESLPDDGIMSPDGRHIVKMTHRGLLPQGETEGTIWLFDAEAVVESIADKRKALPTPQALVRMSATINGVTGEYHDRGNILFELAWSEDSRYLMFLGRDGSENRRLFRVDVQSGAREALTPATQDVVGYSVAGDSVAYLTGPSVNEGEIWMSAGPDIADIVDGTGKPLMPLLYPNFSGYATAERLLLSLWRIRGGKPEPVLDPSTDRQLQIESTHNAVVAALSPDGTKFVTVGSDNSLQNQADKKAGELSYRLVNLMSASSSILNKAPINDFRYSQTGRYMAAWSGDSENVAISETEISREPVSCLFAVIAIRKAEVDCVAKQGYESNGTLHDLRWTDSDIISARFKGFGTGVFLTVNFRRTGRGWIETSGDESNRQSVVLTVREGLNEPPVLLATDVESGNSRVIFDPNPQLQDVKMASVSIYEWQDKNGRLNIGGLVKPPGFKDGHRYPLVIQTHGFQQNRFFRVGYSETSNAGRALAGRDILVLQVKEPQSYAKETWNHAVEIGLDVYLAAIDQLSDSGMIDPKKVGITGYSFTGWTVATSITRAPDRFAAAVLANTDPVTFTGYYSYVDSPLDGAIEDYYVGAAPVGDGLQTWIERVPMLSSDKIQAPVLFSATDPWHLIGIWDFYAALRYQGKPVELQYIRTGKHNIAKPLHKLAHQELITEWFDFWLNGNEDSDTKMSERYRRWRGFRTSIEAAGEMDAGRKASN